MADDLYTTVLSLSDVDGSDIPDSETPETLTAKAETEDLLARAASGLTERDRVLLRMRFEQDLSFRQIGEQLGIGAPAAQRAITRAVDRMRISLRCMGATGVSNFALR